MGERIESFTFRMGRRIKYPWDEWLDGSIWRLVRGTDFECHPETVRTAASSTTHRRGLGFRSNIVDDDTIVIQAYSHQEAGQ